ncbi:MAG: hypothetical protein MUF08_14545 [Burkholderiaceae bacterium]|nr:hypothetical protein [Burkholderiaceae bacterium]
MLGAPGQSAQPTAEPKLRGLPRAGFATANNTHALRTVKYRNAPTAEFGSGP